MARLEVNETVAGKVGDGDGVGASGIPQGAVEGGRGVKGVGVVSGFVRGVGAIHSLNGGDVVQHGGVGLDVGVAEGVAPRGGCGGVPEDVVGVVGVGHDRVLVAVLGSG